MDLFASENNSNKIDLQLPNADVSYFPNFIPSEIASEYFDILKTETPWQQDNIKLFGKTYQQPRLTALYGNNEKPYTYSGITMFPKPFSKPLLQIKHKVEEKCSAKFTSVLLNLYRDGNDSNGWHSDDEKELGPNPFIASLSLGTTRKFQLKHKQDKGLRFNILLEHGSLLIMKGETQKYWQHQIPKSKKIEKARINLTFRKIN